MGMTMIRAALQKKERTVAVPQAIAIVSDLIFRSRITATARAEGLELTALSSPSTLSDAIAGGDVRLVILDLNAMPSALDQIVQTVRAESPPARTVGFCSHVDTELLEAARQAGIDRVMPRSAFVAELPDLLRSFS